LCRPAKRLAKQYLDGADPGSNVRDLYLGSVFLAAVWAREGRPVLPRRSERRIEQRALDLADGLGRDLRESRANLRRVIAVSNVGTVCAAGVSSTTTSSASRGVRRRG
jgi:hypothetical protein